VAPRAPTPGSPWPEMLDRLRAAAQRAQDIPQPVAADAERPRFGINSLINRMTGQASDTPEQGAPAQAVRQQPPIHQPTAGVQAQPESDPEQDRIEIPAFLRRQAN